MEIKSLKKKLIIRCSILGGVVIVASIISVYLSNTEQEASGKRDFLKNEISDLNTKLEGLNAKTLAFSEAVKVWEGFSDGQRELQGLRINDAKDYLDAFKETYQLSDMKVSFSKPAEITEGNTTSTIAVMGSGISIDFKALSDYHAFNFVAAMVDEFPGYVQVNSFSLNRVKEVSKETLEKIAKGEVPGMVDGKISLNWKDFKYKGPVTIKPTEATQ